MANLTDEQIIVVLRDQKEMILEITKQRVTIITVRYV